MSQPPIIIPTLNPTDELIKLVNALGTRGFREIIVVNDGSDMTICGTIFDEIGKIPFCRLLNHPRNLGKGAALKTAFMDYLSRNPDGIGCVTTDDDGQHTAEDIQRIAKEFEKDPESLHLGCRDFSGGDVPWKSKFGNNLTRSIFRLLAGINVADTQTGLRAIPREVMNDSLAICGNRFEFETEMLLRAWDKNINFREMTIQTVYLDNNSGTHFHPVKDAARIYRVIFAHVLRQLFHFLLSSMSSALIDFLLFTLFIHLFAPTLESEKNKLTLPLLGICAAARVISAIWNYLVNRYWVFSTEPERRSAFGKSLLSYMVLCLCIFSASCGLTCILARIVPLFTLPYWKAGIDTVLFLLSFLVQKVLIFRKNKIQNARR